MLRVVTILISCCAGAAAVWFLMPTIGAVPVNPDAPSFAQVAEDAEAPNEPVKKTAMLSAEKRRTRAEQLVGKKFKYITGEEIHSSEWFGALEPQQLERAMDECFLLTEPELSMQHAAALRDEDVSMEDLVDRNDPVKTMQQIMGGPSLKQLQMCKNVFVAYWAAHGETFKF